MRETDVITVEKGLVPAARKDVHAPAFVRQLATTLCPLWTNAAC